MKAEAIKRVGHKQSPTKAEVVEESEHFYIGIIESDMYRRLVALPKEEWEPVPDATWTDVTREFTTEYSWAGGWQWSSEKFGIKGRPGLPDGFRFRKISEQDMSGNERCSFIIEQGENL